MIIFLPTYKRTKMLPLVIRSILDADVNGIDERLVILLRNNHYPSKSEIDSVVATLGNVAPFELQVVHREKMGFFNKDLETIFAHAKEGETIALLGDDDLLAPWGLRNRYREINQQKADFLLSHYVQRVYFFDGGKMCWPDIPAIKTPTRDEAAVPWTFTTAGHVHTMALFNHCWRNTPAFQAGLERATCWADLQQNWSGIYNVGLIPSWLPYTIQASGGKVLSLQEHSVIRGSIFEEAVRQDYADGGTTSFYSLLTYNIFSNPEIFPNQERYVEIKKMYLKGLQSGLWENLGNRNVTFTMLNTGLKASGLSWFDLLGPELLNYRSLLRLFPFFRGWTLKKKVKDQRSLIPTHEFMELLKREYATTADA